MWATDADDPVASPAGLGGPPQGALRESVFNPAQGLIVFRAKEGKSNRALTRISRIQLIALE